MKYQTLKTGDVRKKGDEVRCLDFPSRDWRYDKLNPNKEDTDPLQFHPCGLIGCEIFKSDLCHLEYRRPVK